MIESPESYRSVLTGHTLQGIEEGRPRRESPPAPMKWERSA